VIDKWFAVQASATPPRDTVAAVEALTRHPDFEWKNPNRLRALLGAFSTGNPAGFHAADGGGYRLLTDWLIRLDPLNPRTAARLVAAFGTWRSFDAGRQAHIRTELQRLGATPDLSRDTAEMVGRLLRAETG
jgi:aminopeptidase N